jgi:hypothetical protein
MFIRLLPFPPARFALEDASNCQTHLESVHRVPITAGRTEARCRIQGFYPIAPLLALVLEVATRRRHHRSICSSDAICEQTRNYVLTTREPIPRRLTLCQNVVRRANHCATSSYCLFAYPVRTTHITAFSQKNRASGNLLHQCFLCHTNGVKIICSINVFCAIRTV